MGKSNHFSSKNVFGHLISLIGDDMIKEFNGDNYFNLGYSTDVNHWKSYAKFDIEGKYSVIVIDDSSPNILKTTSNSYGGGLAGALAAESMKWGKNWKDRNGDKKRILINDTEDVSPKRGNRNRSSHGNYMTRKQFQKIMDETEVSLSEEKIRHIEYEKTIEVIKTANTRHSAQAQLP